LGRPQAGTHTTHTTSPGPLPLKRLASDLAALARDTPHATAVIRQADAVNAAEMTEAGVTSFQSKVSSVRQAAALAGLVAVRRACVRVEAEVDEFDIGRVRLGQDVKITAECFRNQSWRGVVEEIPDAVTEKALKPLDPGRPSDSRVLRVKIAFKELTPLRLGQRVEVEITQP